MSKPPIDDPRPALQRLDVDQRDLLEEMVDGFDDRDAVLDWSQDLAIQTLGTIPDWIVQEIATDHLVATMLIVDDAERDQFDVDPATPDAARDFRMDLAGYLLQFTTDAVRVFRTSAAEYTDKSARPDADGDDAPPALRPALATLDARQERALWDLIGGALDDRTDVLDWARSLNLATWGEIGRDVPARVLTEPSTLETITGDDAAHRRARREIAGHILLPAFNAGVRKLRDKSGEDTDQRSTTMETKSL